MKYLDQLNAAANQKKVLAGGQVPAKLTKPSEVPIAGPTKPAKPGSVSFAGSLPPTIKTDEPGRRPSTLEQYAEKLKAATLSVAQEAARADVLSQLERNPMAQRAFVNRFEPDGTLVISLAIRGLGTGELRIPADRFNQACLDDYAMISACFEGRVI